MVAQNGFLVDRALVAVADLEGQTVPVVPAMISAVSHVESMAPEAPEVSGGLLEPAVHRAGHFEKADRASVKVGLAPARADLDVGNSP
jgi:hypothetical protein